jgi:hypothetical protein
MREKIAILVLAALLASAILLTGFRQREVVYDIRLNVFEQKAGAGKSVIGISVDENNLNFGTVPKGAISGKYIAINNTEPLRSKVCISSGGNITEYISWEGPCFVLNNSEEKRIYVQASGRDPGNFSGVLKVAVKTPRYWWLEWTLALPVV